MSKASFPRRFLAGLWRGITRVRLALSNLLFIAMLALIYFVYVGGGPEPLPGKAALLLNISGTVVDQKTLVDPLQAILSEPSAANHQVRLRDVIEAIDFAAADDAITALVMDLDALVYVGISKSQEIVAALERFRASGKPMLAVGDYYTQDQYLLASHADEVILHPLGGVALEGYGSYRNYFREALEKVSVNMHVFRAGENKSAVEPFLRDDMSDVEKAVTNRWLRDLWSQYTTTVEQQRKLEAGAVDAYINQFAARLAAQSGDTATTAVTAGLVDRLMGRQEANEYLADVVGATDDEGRYEAVVFERYVARKRPLSLTGPEGDRVAVITAAGNIMPGEQPPGSIGGDSLARLIRDTAKAEGVKAIVLRINSGGGSMFASELIRQEVIRVTEQDIPLVVSMGSVAASGGYFIAAPADEIWATQGSLTGSIGVFAAFPTFEDLLGRLGVYTDGVGTTELAGSLRPDRPLNPELRKAFDSSVEFAYDTFLGIVAQGRDMPKAEVDAIGQGKVWSAQDALANGLVDKLGGLEQAIASAAAMAGLEDYEVDYVELPLSPRDQLLKQLANRAAQSGWIDVNAANGVMERLLEPLREAAQELQMLQDPGHLYLRCLACANVR